MNGNYKYRLQGGGDLRKSRVLRWIKTVQKAVKIIMLEQQSVSTDMKNAQKAVYLQFDGQFWTKIIAKSKLNPIDLRFFSTTKWQHLPC